jgi:hypothetical protein
MQYLRPPPLPPVLDLWKSSKILLYWTICPSCDPPPFPPVLDLWKSSGIFMIYVIAGTPLPPQLDLKIH